MEDRSPKKTPQYQCTRVNRHCLVYIHIVICPKEIQITRPKNGSFIRFTTPGIPHLAPSLVLYFSFCTPKNLTSSHSRHQKITENNIKIRQQLCQKWMSSSCQKFHSRHLPFGNYLLIFSISCYLCKQPVNYIEKVLVFSALGV